MECFIDDLPSVRVLDKCDLIAFSRTRTQALPKLLPSATWRVCVISKRTTRASPEVGSATGAMMAVAMQSALFIACTFITSTWKERNVRPAANRPWCSVDAGILCLQTSATSKRYLHTRATALSDYFRPYA